ncbi:MAG TPA: hypothetical protein VJ742_12250 [Nitrososphaera sp.]|nr:hypothetical protein [Nitrososphaera sp.]
MAITTLDGALAGMRQPIEFVKGVTGTLVAGRPHSLLYLAGIPGAGTIPTPGISGAALTSYAGQLPFSNPVSGNSYLARLQAQCTQAGTLMLCDRLWHNSGIDVTSTAEQTFTSSALIPARDANGLQVGDGVYAGVEVHTTTGAGTPGLTLKYQNTTGDATKTGVNQTATAASSIAGTFYPLGLAAGDIGIQRAVSLQLSATWTSGAIGVVLYRVIARLELNAQIPNAIDMLTSGFPRMYDNTVPFLVFVPNTTTTSNIMGHMIYTQG